MMCAPDIKTVNMLEILDDVLGKTTAPLTVDDPTAVSNRQKVSSATALILPMGTHGFIHEKRLHFPHFPMDPPSQPLPPER
jgi:hypothetical protein